MNMDELRAIIWDDLFQAQSVKSMHDLAVLTQREILEIRMAVNHEWFTVTEDGVAIAMAAPSSHYHSSK